MRSAKKKNNSGNKTTREDTRFLKSQSQYQLHTRKRSVSEKKPKQEIKKTQSKKRIQRVSTIQERISNIKKGFEELERKIVHSQQGTESLTEPDVKRLMESAARSIKTKSHKKSKSKDKSREKSKDANCHRCVYSKAVFNLISIINYQKAEIESLQGQLKVQRTFR